MQVVVLLASLFLVWHSLWDHPLYPPDEGRYGSVSAWMAEHGNWLQPQLRSDVHVTKPPLTYWAQAVGVLAFGRAEIAVRLPGAVAASIVLLSMFWFVRRTMGSAAATVAVGLYAVMPLPLIVERLGSTDSLLNAWWWLALCFGYLAFAAPGGSAPLTDAPNTAPARGGAPRARPHLGWLAAFWGATALLGLTKGPLILAPLVLICAWLVLTGRWRDAWRTQAWLGLPLALVPLGVVAYLYWQANPERTARIWNFEFVERITGGGGHNDPVWMFVPLFLGGFFPASAMLMLPWLNVSARRAWSAFTGGDLRALMLLAVVLPFIGFSLLSGKQPTYILPLAPPLAVLVTHMLMRWLQPRAADADGLRLPDVRWTCMAAAGVMALGAPVAAAWVVREGRAPAWAPGWTLVWWSLVFLPLALGWATCGHMWWDRVRRGLGLGCAFAGMVFMWLGVQMVENHALDAMNARGVAAAMQAGARPMLVVGVRDLTVDFYAGAWTDWSETSEDVPAWIAAHPDGLVLLSEDDIRRGRVVRAQDLDGLSRAGSFLLWPFKPAVLLQKVVPGTGVPTFSP